MDVSLSDVVAGKCDIVISEFDVVLVSVLCVLLTWLVKVLLDAYSINRAGGHMGHL